MWDEQLTGQTRIVDHTPWTPTLTLETRTGHCRLHLEGITYGNGRDLQEAGTDLLVRLFDLAVGVRQEGYRLPSGVDPRVPDFLWEIGELALQGGDLRGRVFG